MSVARRIRRHHAIGFRHVARLGRPIYRRRKLLDVSAAIVAEKRKAARQAQIKRK